MNGELASLRSMDKFSWALSSVTVLFFEDGDA
jgi:hypothetical protein